MISLQSVQLGYDRTVVIENIDFSVTQGDFLAIVGTNGCGKTTLLRSMMQMLRPLRGKISVSSQAKIGYVPQKDSLDILFPLTVFEVVQMGILGELKLLQRVSHKYKDSIEKALSQVNITDKSNDFFRDLSGGQRQKALIARALVSRPNCLMLDEPTTGIDLPSQFEILDLISKLHKEHNITVVMISHRLDMVIKYAEKVGIIYKKLFSCGPKNTIITTEKLSQIYDYPLQIVEIDGTKIVVGVK